MELPEVEDMFVYPSCGDETSAMGAAYWTYAHKVGVEKMTPLQTLYWGPQHSDAEIEQAITSYKFQSKVRCQRISNMELTIAALLASGRIVARHAGREEFGARALGNRSILANPSNAHATRVINEAIKARDFWMPFATSILSERANDYLINPKKIRSPFMILTFDTTERRNDLIAAMHPFDYTVRPQIVEYQANPRYHSILKEFERLTGIGAILNTSFNLHGFPVASSPRDSLEVFDRSGLTTLAIENWLVEKE
jgi:carbamoyltransferase